MGEPIRVVENPAGARTASSGNRTSAPAGNQAPRTLPPINAIPAVVAAPPGIVTYNDIRLPTPRGAVAE
jgi:hypothetical protein